MRKISLMMSVSLDGFMEGVDRDISWHVVDEELHQHFNDTLRPLGAFVDGRVTHELMAAYWPTADADPDASPVTAEFAAIWRDKPKIVYSRTLPSGPAEWNTTIVSEVVPEEVRALKAQPGGDLGLGGADLAATFLRHDLVDEIKVYVHPVLIGSGRRMFLTDETDTHSDTATATATDTRTALRLVESRAFGNGVVLLRYERARPDSGAR
ncbi:dihydrofolate reductase family protein [Streptomyces sp. MBT65]|uniref:dihydrofolate reductase family protein n=1 Tax=Streptomyces sp. MBT65 TaxID=1488395 RepID=UPI00190A1BDC|nr:dihydrofolate reductase family protein [Streptomyces sp. MBT65]MBK3581874.1 dihydrofolate reductase family protein [Streptomyces sp. MBT65]